MISDSSRVCLITPGHLSSTPRLVKEAEALAAAGASVHVVAGRHFPPSDALDEDLLTGALRDTVRIDARRGTGTFGRKLLRLFSRRAIGLMRRATVPLAIRAHHTEVYRLAAAAARQGADLYIGHCLAGLAAAALAAARTGARYGFDAEDYHDAETAEAETDPVERRLRHAIHARYLPGCVHRTAASPLIGAAYAEHYGIAPPAIVLNVFPRSHAPRTPVVPPPVGPDRPARCYWFSQTVGPGRGLETWVDILTRLRTPAELHVRGHLHTGYDAMLQARARSAGLRHPIVFHAPAPAPEMVRLAAPFDLGLSLEETRPLNRDLCLTNKIFVYLLAGIPQLLSRTRAQTALAPELGAAGLLADAHRPETAARLLDELLGSPERLAAARAAAWRLAQSRFCWDVEQQIFLGSAARACT